MSEHRNGAADDAWVNQAQQNITDHDWAWQQWEFVERYGGQVILLHRREVIGAGEDHRAATEAARAALANVGRELPPPDEWVYFVVPTRDAVEQEADFVETMLAAREVAEKPA